jgi:hypothetical protein
MNEVPDENDLVYNTYGLDIEALLRFVYEKLTNQSWDELLLTLQHYWDIYSFVAIVLSLIFFIGFVYAKIRYGQLYAHEHERLHGEEHEWASQHEHGHTSNARWEHIQERVQENSPTAWRVAIIEADIMLEETLNTAGYIGNTLGEKLKSANPQSFTTVQDAWEAHKVRNEVAHAGSDFVLTKKIAQETLVRYERVFREFGVI